MNSKMFDLTNRTAFVTGGSKGIGLAIASALAEAGAKVVIAGRSEAALQAATAQLAEVAKAEVAYLVVDLSQRDEANRLGEALVTQFPAIDILVNNAGSNTPQAIDEVADDTWAELLELNLSSSMRLMRAVTPGMKTRRWGRIINISSIMGLASKEGRNAYSASKAGLIGLSRAAALELAPHGITVNCIAPGPFLTDLPKAVFSKTQIDTICERVAMGRFGNPDELKGPVLLLASDAGSYITGSTLVVDGGAMARTM